ncbi:MAG: hypothetical protein JWL86_5420 [Rhizobium sp.]|nr:hypothetical protein [Rhizobium sp.]
MSLETIVRPFQTADFSPPKPVVASGQSAPSNLVLTFGKSGSGRTFNGSESVSIRGYVDRKPKEEGATSSP